MTPSSPNSPLSASQESSRNRRNALYVKRFILTLLVGAALWNNQRGLLYGSSSSDTRNLDDDEAAAPSSTSKSSSNNIQQSQQSYTPSSLEDYVITNAAALGYNQTSRSNRAVGCTIWKNASVTTPQIYQGLQQFREELAAYHTALENMDHSNIPKDLRDYITDDDKSICDKLQVHPDGLQGIFKSNSLSNGNMGLLEPLLTPLRHPDICFLEHQIMNMQYLVHDFAHMCRHVLKPNSRTIFVDMGAALDFHKPDGVNAYSPAVYITQMYQRFGFHFDHIYAFEINKKEPDEVYQAIPDDLKAAYHWYNVGVDANIESSNNPLKLLLDNYRENDFVIVKLDIDTPFLEVPMAEMVANDERLHKIIDAFYFEHHVFLSELAPYWKRSMRGSVQQSLEMFRKMRENGVASHYWP